MERSRRKTKQNSKGRRSPTVPIETYRWEDVRRARRRGGYPWTHLSKGPFDEDIDPDQYTMDAIRRTKSSSTMGRSDGVDILEISTNESGVSNVSLTHLEIVTDPEEHLRKGQRQSSLLIEELPADEDGGKKIESGESSDNISQYLDQEERGPPSRNGRSQPTDDGGQRARSEEGAPRKRKLSADSGRSRISLSKLAVMKRLKEAKDKIKLPKVPKITFPTRRGGTKRTTPPKEAKTKKEKDQPAKAKKSEKPVYIHIPLKPPPGETDEFSYLEEVPKGAEVKPPAKAEEQKTEAQPPRKEPLVINPVFKQLLKDVRRLKDREEFSRHSLKRKAEPQEGEVVKPEEPEPTEHKTESAAESKTDAEEADVKEPEPEKEESKTKPEEADVKDQRLEPEPEEEESRTKPEEADVKDDGEPMDVDVESKPPDKFQDQDVFDTLFHREAGKAKPTNSRAVRSQSAEPQRKRRSSIESSHSRKSLSKLGIIKKLKEASEKIKSSFSLSSLKKEDKDKKKERKPRPSDVVRITKHEPPKDTTPVYIHIPLRPPEGKTDEFSHLEFETQAAAAAEPPTKKTDTPESSPSSPPNNDIQFIFLTPPSDDEVLDQKISEIPDTPESDDVKFFNTLQTLAKNAVDQVSPESKKKLETVAEENDKSSTSETEEETSPMVEEEATKMMVDVEDGLNESPGKHDELKSSIKADSAPPAIKKKVSFKRKSKVDKDGDYEEVQAPKDEVQAAKIDLSQSMSVDEERSYLDQKIVKDASLEEDYNKWSKVSDHEYEPVNPPDEVTVMTSVLPSVKVVDTEIDPGPRVVFSAVEVFETKPSPTEERKSPIFHFHHSDEEHVEEEQEKPKTPEGPGKFQMAFRQKTEQLKHKLQNVKPDFKKFKIEKPHLNFPKIPDTVKFNVPFKLPQRSAPKPDLKKTRQYSTESNAGDPVKKPIFDFSTFPKFMKKKHKEDLSGLGTLPKTKPKDEAADEETWSAAGSVKISLHSDTQDEEEEETSPKADDEEEREVITVTSRIRYVEDIDIDDDYERENQEINEARQQSARWSHGRFNPVEEAEAFEEKILAEASMKRSQDQIKDEYSSEGSISLNRKGFVGKIDVDSDEFFVVHQVHEGIQTPANALAQMNEYDPIGSNRSLPEAPSKRKPIKKPKRKKTPHVSQEEIPYDEESLEDSSVLMPSRPRRKSKRKQTAKSDADEVVPYQETIALEQADPNNARLEFPRESLGVLGDDELEEAEFDLAYENEKMEGKEQPEILVMDPYRRFQFVEIPEAPPRRHRSLKSLTASENGSIILDIIRSYDDEKLEDYNNTVPRRPDRRSRSHASSVSRGSLPPSSRDESILGTESYTSEGQIPCVEEPCVQDIRDYMGYAVVDKQAKPREPPLPPPRGAPRRSKRQATLSEHKFATVPRNAGRDPQERPPVRPLRNYSTLGQVKKKYADEDKENVESVAPEDDSNRDLQSGPVVQKMRQRPLPAPPRPPRKPRTFRTSLKDITSEENIMGSVGGDQDKSSVIVEETVSTQTDPLPDDFVCEDVPIQQSDRLVSPTHVRRELITPTYYTHEETVTHGTLLVEPLDGAKILPDSQLSRERVIPIVREESDGETSEIPEHFTSLKSPQVVKTEKLEVSDLDVDRLRVNELTANKILVSEIDSESIKTNDIQSASGSVNINDIGLPPELVKEIVRSLISLEKKTEMAEEEEKKTPTEEPPSPEIAEQSNVSTGIPTEVPLRPPRQVGRFRQSSRDSEDSPTNHREFRRTEMLEPEVDDQPPPRPPVPLESCYLPSQPPVSFYALRAQRYVEDMSENIPSVPRRKKHHHRSRPISRSKSTSDESSTSPAAPRGSRPRRRSSEPSIPELTGRLVCACGDRANGSIKRLIRHLTENVLGNADGDQDLHVYTIVLLVLIAGLILLGYGEERTVVHLHHWEYFNPPTDL